MRTLVVSDFHLGARDGDLLRDPGILQTLAGEIERCDELVILGDALELRHRPVADVLDVARPLFEVAAEALGDGRILVVPGNHDYQLATPLIERRQLRGTAPLGLEHSFSPASGPLGRLARKLPVEVELSYPGAWLRPDVYAIHGHYLDCHFSLPTFECLTVSALERLAGRPSGNGRVPDDYEGAQAPLYAFAYAMAQTAAPRLNRAGPNPSARVWAAMRRPAPGRRWRSRLLGSVVVPGAVRAANLAGLGPYHSDFSIEGIGRAGVDAMRQVVSRLGVEAPHVVFGHTHRPGPLAGETAWRASGGGRLHNSGSWLYAPMLLGRTAAGSVFWPGTCLVIEDEGPPRLRRLLDGISHGELRAAARTPPVPR